MFIPEFSQKSPPQRPPVEPIMAFWTYQMQIAHSTYKVGTLTHRHNMMHLQIILVKQPAAFFTTATVLLPYSMLHAQQLLSVVAVEVITLVSPFHAACCHIDVDGPDTETFEYFHNHNILLLFCSAA